MRNKKHLKVWPFLVLCGILLGGPMTAAGGDLTPIQVLGKLIMFDRHLSLRHNQSCVSCHADFAGWTGPSQHVNRTGAVYPGSVHTRFGNRKPPSAAYATTSPLFDFDSAGASFFGGNFWDGRATGWDLGNPAADQARGPFLNPVEQALPDKAAVVQRVCFAYGPLFKLVWGADACKNVDGAYDKVAHSIAAYEDSKDVNAFSSKYDAVMAGRATFTAEEEAGFDLFNGKGKCSLCHVQDGAGPAGEDLFTDYTFDNLGVPKNPMNPAYEADPDFVDRGLGDFLRSLTLNDTWRSAPYVTANVSGLTTDDLLDLADTNDGKHKVPTLRNVGKQPHPKFAKAYGHNGYFKSLPGIVHFYNTRDVLDQCPGDFTEKEALAANCWPAPEEPANVNSDELGDLGLTQVEENAIVAFLKSLSDGHKNHRH
jgi:cytochrome c peroxidase